MIKVGIPRALLYYQYYPMWKTFFEELGADVVVSPSTTQSMLSEGSARVVADTCLPVKLFLGHVLSLVGKCDYMFIPAIRSLKPKVYNCSKFLGLPDMTRAVIPESPPILDIDIDIDQGKRQLYQAIYKLGRYFTRNPLKIRRASAAAWESHLSYLRLMASHRLTPPLAIERLTGLSQMKPGLSQTKPNIPANQPDSTKTVIAVIGHPYLLYDEQVNYRLISRLKQAGHRVLTPEMLTPEELETGITKLTGKAYWTYEEDVVGAGGHYLGSGVDGIISIIAFGCGPDSVMIDAVRRQAARLRTTPFMNLTLDEHAAEAGVITRLEAFLDMIQRRKRRKVKTCA